MAICHNAVYDRIYNSKTVLLHIASTWIAGVIITGPVVVGFQGHGAVFDRRTVVCVRTYLAETGKQYPIDYIGKKGFKLT